MTNVLEENLEEIEITINAANSYVERMHALLRLSNNPDFKLLIDVGYFQEEASRLVMLKADHEMQSPERQAEIERCIIAIGQLRQHFRAVMQLGRMAEKSIKDDEETRSEILNESLDS